MRSPRQVKAKMKENPRNENGSHALWLPFS
jgi:hypothetical protein